MNYYQRRTAEDQLQALRGGVEAELCRLPGICRVGLGIVRRGGIPTGELGFIVYTARKRARIDLPSRELIPSQICGFPTDVQAVPLIRAECCSGGVRPVMPGLEIGASPNATNNAVSAGTLGCLVELANQTRGLTNDHVVGAATSEDRRMFQPHYDTKCGSPINEIGSSLSENRNRGNATFQGKPYYLDYALIEFKGTDFKSLLAVPKAPSGTPETVTLPPGTAGSVTRSSDGRIMEIRDAGGILVDPKKIAKERPAVSGTLVFKVGATTGLTVGYVEKAEGPCNYRDVMGNIVTGDNQITIRPLAGYRDPKTGTEHFTRSGDSGSVYLDLENHVVGLHHGGTDTNSFASPIAPVLDAVGGATVVASGEEKTNASAAASTRLAQELWASSPAEAFDLNHLERQLRQRLLESPEGRMVLGLIEAYAGEITKLVWHRRAVTTVWHRHHGPAFVALCARALTTTGTPLPREAGGTPRRKLLEAMADVLLQHGSDSLRSDIADARPWLLHILAGCRDLDELLSQLAERSA